MVRWNSGQKDVTRHRILAAAGRLFRESGYTNTSVADVMKEAGLTVGGFYSHFESKEELLSAVLAEDFDRLSETLLVGLEGVEGPTFVREVTSRYLSRLHRDAPAHGCPLPPLATEVGRQGGAPREQIEGYLLRLVEALTKRASAPTGAKLSTEELALALTALSVGGILLARAVQSDSLSTNILRACRRLAAATVTP